MEKLKELFEASSLPGVPILVTTKYNQVKIIWSILLIVSIGTSGYFIYDSINDYFEYQIITNIDVIREEESQFPTITFCVPNNDEQNNNNKTYFLSNYFTRILRSCQFDLTNCTYLDFELYKISNQFQINETCFRFNSGRNYINKATQIKNISNYDPNTGLILLLIIDNYFINKGPFKVKLFIQNYSTIFRRDHAYSYESGIYISSGITFISFERNFVDRLPKPYNDCIEQDTRDYVSNLFQYFRQINKTYLQKDCFDLCVEEIKMKTCNCTAGLGSSLNCSFNDNCIESFRLSNNTKSKLPSTCLAKCPLECDSVNYKFITNYAGTLSDEFNLLYNITTEESNKIVYLSLHYSSLDYSLVKQIVKTQVFDLISNVGGTLGLFIGLSFFTFVELILVCIEFIFYLLDMRKNRVDQF
jgi:hypothetical protein